MGDVQHHHRPRIRRADGADQGDLMRRQRGSVPVDALQTGIGRFAYHQHHAVGRPGMVDRLLQQVDGLRGLAAEPDAVGDTAAQRHLGPEGQVFPRLQRKFKTGMRGLHQLAHDIPLQRLAVEGRHALAVQLEGDLPGAADPEAVAAAHRRGELAAYRHGGAFGQAQHVADARHIAEPDQRGGVAHLLMNHAPVSGGVGNVQAALAGGGAQRQMMQRWDAVIALHPLGIAYFDPSGGKALANGLQRRDQSRHQRHSGKGPALEAGRRGVGANHRQPLSRLRGEGQQPLAIVQQDKARRRRLFEGVTPLRLGGGRAIPGQRMADPFGQPRQPGGGIVKTPGVAVGIHQRGQQALAHMAGRARHLQIQPGAEAGRAVLGAEPVGHHQPVPAEIALQPLADGLMLLGAIDPVHPVIGGQHAPDAAAGRHFERPEIDFAQGGFIDDHVHGPPIGFRIVADHMLDDAAHPLALDAVDPRCAQLGDMPRVFAEKLKRAAGKGAAQQVQVRRQQRLRSGAQRLLADDAANPADQLAVPAGAKRQSAGAEQGNISLVHPAAGDPHRAIGQGD